MNKEERKKTLLTLPIEILVDLVIAGDEIEERNAKAIEYIKEKSNYDVAFGEYSCLSDLEPYECDELLKILKGEYE